MPGPTIIPLTVACLLAAAHHQNIPPAVLWGLWGVERGWPGASVENSDGSHDLGSLQINDRTWIDRIARLQFGGDRKLATLRVQYDGCYNAQVGAWIFAQELAAANGDLATAIGHYHSHTPALAHEYTRSFLTLVARIYATPARARPIAAQYHHDGTTTQAAPAAATRIAISFNLPTEPARSAHASSNQLSRTERDPGQDPDTKGPIPLSGVLQP